MMDGVQIVNDSKCDTSSSESKRTEQPSLFINGKGTGICQTSVSRMVDGMHANSNHGSKKLFRFLRTC